MAKYKIRKIYLSRYFDKNCQFIASMCPRCYEEQYDMKIIAVNNKFLEKYSPVQLPYFHNNHKDDEEILYILDEPHQNINTNLIQDNETKLQDLSILKEDFPDIKEENKLFFIPPKSPHNLIEESLYSNPWALLVATIFLNKTSCYQAGPYITDFLKDYSSPEKVLKSKPEDLEKYFIKLGLMKRSVQIWKMSHDYLNKNWRDVGELYGIGKYGQDAYQMFCRGNMEVEPKDRFLRIYKAWYEMVHGKPRKFEDSDIDMKYDESFNDNSYYENKDEMNLTVCDNNCLRREYKENIEACNSGFESFEKSDPENEGIGGNEVKGVENYFRNSKSRENEIIFVNNSFTTDDEDGDENTHFMNCDTIENKIIDEGKSANISDQYISCGKKEKITVGKDNINFEVLPESSCDFINNNIEGVKSKYFI